MLNGTTPNQLQERKWLRPEKFLLPACMYYDHRSIFRLLNCHFQIDKTAEIGLKHRFDHFYLSYLIKIDVGETQNNVYLLQCPQEAELVYVFVLHNRYRARQELVLMAIKRTLTQFVNISFLQITTLEYFIRIYFSHFVQNTSRKMHRTYMPYSATGVLQILP